jgi:hypothetical protein
MATPLDNQRSSLVIGFEARRHTPKTEDFCQEFITLRFTAHLEIPSSE